MKIVVHVKDVFNFIKQICVLMSVCVVHFKCHLNVIWANTTNENLFHEQTFFQYDSNSRL